MKSQTLPTKRRPVSKGVFRRLSAKTKTRKQRASATATARDFDADDGNSKISRALTIIFLIHVVAIGLIFIHHRFLSGRTVETVKVNQEQVDSQAVDKAREGLTPLSSGEAPYIVKPGDSYQAIARSYGVHVNDLKSLNQNVTMRTGLILQIPAKRVIVAKPMRVVVTADAPVEPAVETVTPTKPARDEGLVQAIDFRDAPKAQVVSQVVASGGSYVVQKGDTIWGISKKFKVDHKFWVN